MTHELAEIGYFILDATGKGDDKYLCLLVQVIIILHKL